MATNQNIPGWPEMPSITGSASHLNNAFTNGLAGGMDFIKNFWSNSASGVPGLVVPTVDLQELEKRIKDLKAVEGWLDVNINMLRTTIQALEVQHSTIATIHALSDSMTATTADATKNMMDNAASSVAYSASPTTTSMPTQTPAKSRQRKSKDQPNSGLPPGWPTSGTTAAPQTAKARQAAKTTPAAKAKPAAKPAVKKAADKPAAAADVAVTNAAEQAAASASAWMNFLQDQFTQVARKSLTPAAGEASKTAVTKSAATKAPAKKAAAKNKK